MIKIMSKINITNLGRPELPMGSVMISELPGPKITVNNTSAVRVSSFPSNDQMLLEGKKVE